MLSPLHSRCPVLIAGVLLLGIAQGRAEAEARLAVFRLDPLGVEAEIVGRLDALLRMELGRLADAAMPSPQQVAKLLAKRPALKDCTGEVRCLAAVGKALSVGRIISGNVGGLAGNYVLNVKMVDVARRVEERRIQETISGQPDQLIEAVRVAAYRLVAPERLRGSLDVLANISGAEVVLDGKPLGKTPLASQRGLAVGRHTLRVSKLGYTDVVQQVEVRLQKATQVVVTLQAPLGKSSTPAKPREVNPWYTRWWVWTAVGVAAAGLGAALGYAVSSSPEINCATDPARCGLQ